MTPSTVGTIPRYSPANPRAALSSYTARTPARTNTDLRVAKWMLLHAQARYACAQSTMSPVQPLAFHTRSRTHLSLSRVWMASCARTRSKGYVTATAVAPARAPAAKRGSGVSSLQRQVNSNRSASGPSMTKSRVSTIGVYNVSIVWSILGSLLSQSTVVRFSLFTS